MRRLLALLLVLAGTAAAASVAVTAPAGKPGAPGDYVTLVFHLSGEGEIDVAFSADYGATVLAPTRHLSLTGTSGLFATVHVPDDARAGTHITVRLQAKSEGQVVAQSESAIEVASVVAPQVALDGGTRAIVGELAQVRGYVTNAGNAADRVTLAPQDSPWPISVSPRAVDLAPGENAPVVVTVVPGSDVSSGYRYLVRLVATSTSDPSKVARAQAIITFLDPQQEAIRKAGGLALVFGVSASGLASAVLDAGTWSVKYQYSVRPSLTGALSDYIQGDASTTPIHGSEAGPLVPPSSGRVTLQADSWSAGLSVSANSVGLSGDVDVGDWQVSMGSSLSFGGGRLAVSGSAGLQNLVAAPDLGLTGDFFIASGVHHERFGVRYTYHFSPDLSLGGGADVYGIHTLGSAYYAVPSFTVDGSYRGPAIATRASYTTLPTFGQHIASADLSSTFAGPLGFVVSAKGTLSPGGHHANASATVFGFPLPSTGLSGNLRFNEVSGTDEYGTLTGAVQASTGFPLTGGSGGISASYAHTMPLWGSSSAADDAEIAVGGTVAPVHAQLNAGYGSQGATAQQPAHQSLRAGGAVVVTPLATTTLSASYTYTDVLLPDPEQKHGYGVWWDQAWGWGVSSRLDYERTWDFVAGLPPSQPESLAATISFSNFLLPGLDLDVGYAIGSDIGLLVFDQPYSHTFSLGLGYGVRVPFQTPPSIVALFGGRKSGLLYGRALARRGGSERPLVGVTIALGDQQTVTGQDGSYELRVAPGVYDLSFPAGLPATLGLEGDPRATIVLDQQVRRDLVFQPVVNLSVAVFDDKNQNGRKDADEEGIPYAGVSVSGPVVKQMRADGSGNAVISGLPAGHYSVSPDGRFLPPGYRPTSDPVAVDLAPPALPPAVAVGAARPPKAVVTTFQAGDVSIFGAVGSGLVPAGADVTVKAQTTGPVSAVTVQLFGTTTAMTGGGSAWQATVHVPEDAAAGLTGGRLVANPGQAHSAQTTVQVEVTHGRLFQAQPFAAVAGSPGAVAVRVLFRASHVELRIGDGAYPLTSEDGYLWQGTVTLTQAGDTEAHVIADGRDLGTIRVSVSEGGG